MDSGGIALLFLLFGMLGFLGGSGEADAETDDTDQPEGEQPPEVAAPNIFDDTNDPDNGEVDAVSAGDILSGGIAADGPGAENVDSTTPDDLLRADVSDVAMLGGVGNDELRAHSGSNLLIGGAGDDLIEVGTGTDLAFGGSGNDSFGLAGGGAHTAHGGDGNDYFFLRSGSNTLNGDGGDDYFDGRGIPDGDNELNGGSGDDVFLTQTVGSNPVNTVTGGSGNDLFSTIGTVPEIVLAPSGATTITDFGNDDGGSGDGDTANNDYLDLFRHYDSLQEAKDDLADDGNFDELTGFDVTGLTADDLTEDNTGLSDTPGFVEADARFAFGSTGQTVYLVPTPIVNAAASVSVNWGNGDPTDDFWNDDRVFEQRYREPGVYTVTVTVENAANNSDSARFEVDTINQTITKLPPVVPL